MKKGFTLAEVLLALTIIGVIAALTLPGLRSNIGTRKSTAWYKKYCNILDSATSQAMYHNNVPHASNVTIEQLRGQLKGQETTLNGVPGFYMKDGSLIMAGENGSVKVKFPEHVHIANRAYFFADNLDGIDCSTFGQAIPGEEANNDGNNENSAPPASEEAEAGSEPSGGEPPEPVDNSEWDECIHRYHSPSYCHEAFGLDNANGDDQELWDKCMGENSLEQCIDELGYDFSDKENQEKWDECIKNSPDEVEKCSDEYNMYNN